MEKVAQHVSGLIESFLVSRRVSGCTEATLAAYRMWLDRFAQEIGDTFTPLAVRQFFASLQDQRLKPASVHKAYQVIRTFLRWALAVGEIETNPLVGFSIRSSKTLPQVPTEDELRAVLRLCSKTGEGYRNRAMILVMADAGLRASEVLHLLVEDWNPQERSLFIRSGKGQKDRVTFVAPTTARAIREYVGTRAQINREDFLFVTTAGRPLKRRHLVQILHRLSTKAKLGAERRLHPHALRHFAATSWLRNGVGLDEVRRLLGHESLATTLRYSSLVASDLQHAHKRAGAIERMRLE
jgi:site-specific recombinase XerD